MDVAIHEMRAIFRHLTALLCIWCFACACFAQAAPRHISQYGHTAWRLEDGYFQSAPQTIGQTTDGYLWIGTQAGALRFDGITFSRLLNPAGKEVSGNIVSLLGASDGSLWLGTDEGMMRSYKGQLQPSPRIRGRIDGIMEDHSHRIWIARARAGLSADPLCEIIGYAAHCHGKQEGIAEPYATALEETNDRAMWVAHVNTLSRWSEGKATILPLPAKGALRGPSGIAALLANDDGSMWVGTTVAGRGMGLQREVDGKLVPFKIAGFNSEQVRTAALLHDSDGALWVGTINDGLYRIKDGVADHYRSTDGLSSDAVYSLFEDKEKNIWVATSSGIDRFRILRVTTFSLRDGLSSGIAASVVAAHDGTVWVGSQGGLDAIRDGKVTSIRPHGGLPGNVVTSMAEDRDGLLWIGIDDRLFTYDGKQFAPIIGPKGSPLGSIRAVVQDARAKDIYALALRDADTHFLHIRSRQVIADLDIKARIMARDPAGGALLVQSDGLQRWTEGRISTISEWNGKRQRISSLLVGSDGTIWAASSLGLLGSRGGPWVPMDAARGLPCTVVERAIEDRQGSLWLYMPCGLVIISKDEIQRFWADPRFVVRPRLLSVLDGYYNGQSTFNPTISLARDGRIWSVNGQVAQVVNSNSISLSSYQPPVHVERIVADNTVHLAPGPVELPALIHNVEINYTGIGLAVPQKIQFRYRLAGLEQAWQNAGTRRQAFYTNLRPGSYKFEVQASNADGVWGEQEASTDIAVAPAFYQTTWFTFVEFTSGIFCVYLVYLYRLRFVTGQVQTRLMERLAERERLARDLHDTFFQSIQGLFLKFNTGTTQLGVTDPARAIFIEALKQSDQAMLEGRELLLDLRASIDAGELAILFAQAGDELQAIHTTMFKVTVLGQAHPLHPSTAGELYRVGKEALYNAFRHSDASKIEIEIEYTSDNLSLRIRDDGKGIDEQVRIDGKLRGHWGLPGMHERAAKIGGKLNVWSRKDNGTEIEMTVPAKSAYLMVEVKLVPMWLQLRLRRVWPFGGVPNA